MGPRIAAVSARASRSEAPRAKLREPFDSLGRTLRAACAGRRIVFLQNSGNFGDALIRYGTMRFFEDLGLRPAEYDMGSPLAKAGALLHGLAAKVRDDTVFLYSGSGAWANACDIGWRNVRRLRRVNPRIVVLPSTYEAFAPPEGMLAFARDRAESLERAPHAAFCHDMAFYLATIDPERVLPGRTPPTRGLGVAFRLDNEARPHGLADLPDNEDISGGGLHSDDPQALLRRIDAYESIITDRLHIAIGAAILGKAVHLVSGSYFKIRAIHEASIAPFFPRCRLVTDDEARDVLSRYGMM